MNNYAALTADAVGGCQAIIAFLYTIAVSEGTYNIGDRGYNCIVGSTVSKSVLFTDYSRHPNQLVHFDNGTPDSTAAGRYQLLYRYWLAYQKQLKLADFSPINQDRIALQMLREVGAFQMLKDGNFAGALVAARSRWASLPGAGYGQHEQKITYLAQAYATAGGA